MRDPERIEEIVPLLQCIWRKYPDLRLGQLVSILAAEAGKGDMDVFQVEDDDILIGIQKYLEKMDAS